MPKGSRHIVLIITLFMAASIAAAAEKLPKADRIPLSPTEQHRVLISEGVRLHDAGQYDEAILKYQEVLEKAPDVVEAIYELGFTYFHKKDYENALALARQGIRYKSELLPELYVLLGNSLDDLGKTDEAIEVYRAAIKRSPKTALLHYNLGLALVRSGKDPEAKKALQQSLFLAPDHASSHYLLATVYYRLGYKIPAILALSRFLLLEPQTPRAREALPALDRLITGGVSQGKDPNHINITLNLSPDSKKDEGDFDAVETVMSISVAVGHTEKAEKESPFQRLASTYGVMAGIMSDLKPKGFAAKYYVPFFAEMGKRELSGAVVHRVFQLANLEGAALWQSENSARIEELQKWLAEYQWPAK